ncbi:hypothetical protein Bca52824_059709 [Brassica carinata]|uniref:Naphthoate synthase n=1 Tax=Brassica carinata TaxID=52824 RepID=A0A8X7UFY3_BRACI|nr:hypothetical protein Bca52824_059709 [Brassica carinata]
MADSKELGTASRRISVVTNHLIPSKQFQIKWNSLPLLQFVDIIYEKAVGEDIAKFLVYVDYYKPAGEKKRVPASDCEELMRAFNDARDDSSVGVIILTGKGTKAFCSGGDQALRTPDGYADPNDVGRLNVLDLQVQIRRLPKPVIAMVAGYAVGGGHILHMVCDLTIAADNAIFGQTGPKVGSFDAGYGSSIMSRLAREMWFMTRFYTASEADKMGLINTVVPLEDLEKETVKWCREILRNSPTAIRVLKAALNAVDDGHAGLQGLAGDATLLFYGTEEGIEGRTAYMQRRPRTSLNFPGDLELTTELSSGVFIKHLFSFQSDSFVLFVKLIPDFNYYK